MDADRQVSKLESQDQGALARALRWGKNQFSLDNPEQDFLSPETAGDMALGMIPGVGQAMAVRDMVRGVRAEDPAQVGMAAASLLPFGKLAGALRNKSEVIAGEKALKADMDALSYAKGKTIAGGKNSHPYDIYADSGWYQGAENHAPWKWEIPDHAMLIKEMRLRPDEEFSLPLQQIIHHPELFANYPDLRTLTVQGLHGPSASGGGAYYAPHGKNAERIEASGRSLQDFKETLLHEIQHAIQRREGFDPGANPDAVYRGLKAKHMESTGGVLPTSLEDAMMRQEGTEKYMKNMGESEARMVEERFRKGAYTQSVHPYNHYDRPIEQLIAEEKLPGYARALRNRMPSD